jgi:hypothetical protein
MPGDVADTNMGTNTFSLSFAGASGLSVTRGLTNDAVATAAWSVVEFP